MGWTPLAAAAAATSTAGRAARSRHFKGWRREGPCRPDGQQGATRHPPGNTNAAAAVDHWALAQCSISTLLLSPAAAARRYPSQGSCSMAIAHTYTLKRVTLVTHTPVTHPPIHQPRVRSVSMKLLCW
jgi:hypothetical protein